MMAAFTAVAARPFFLAAVLAWFVPVVVVIAGSVGVPTAAITVFRLLLMSAVAIVVPYCSVVPRIAGIIGTGLGMVMSVARILVIVFHTMGDGAGPGILQPIRQALFR